MPRPDLNLLVTLDVLLAEGSVARAAQRLRLSPSAMSRALARLRETTGDPLLVRAGRGLVPTPRAIELRERVGQLVAGRSRCARAKVSWRTSDPGSLRASPGTRLPCGCASCRSRTETDRKSTRLNSSHVSESRMPSSA